MRYLQLADDLANQLGNSIIESKNLLESFQIGEMSIDELTKERPSRHGKQSLHSMNATQVFSEEDTFLYERRGLDDDINDQSMPSMFLNGGNEAAQVLGSGVQGLTPTMTQSFVENVSSQFEKLFKNLDQIGETKLHDGVTKRNKSNPVALGGSSS